MSRWIRLFITIVRLSQPTHVTAPPTCARWATLAMAAMTLGVWGCSPTYSPPIRSGHQGAAGRQQPGEWVVGGSTNLALTGGPYVSIPLGEDVPVHVEAGGELAGLGGGWSLGYLGARFTYDTRSQSEPQFSEYGDRLPKPELGFAVDGEMGLGAGVGGEHGERLAAETRPPPDMPFAYGGYLGLGVAGHFASWFALWMRGRIQASKATRVPNTRWYSLMAGPEFKAGPVFITPSTGLWAYENSKDDALGFNVELGIGLVFD